MSSNKRELKVKYTKGQPPKRTNPFGKDVLVAPEGQLKYPGMITRIPGGNITMNGVPYPVMAIPNVGQPTMMYPGVDYSFPGSDYVDEIPLAKTGGWLDNYQKGGYSWSNQSGNYSVVNPANTSNFVEPKKKTISETEKKLMQQQVVQEDGTVTDGLGNIIKRPEERATGAIEESASPIDLIGSGIYSGGAKMLAKGLNKAGSKLLPKSFKSEIDWAKWNKEIPANKALMQEYNAIEQTSKANGTWMKNPDGSAFQGTPEQFIQQNSSNFKKAFPEGHNTVYRGTQAYNPELTTLRGTGNGDAPIIFGTSNKSVAENYATHTGYNLEDEFQKVGKRVEFYHPDKSKIGVYTGEAKDVNPGLFELGVGKDLPTIVSQGNKGKWYNVENKEVSDWLKTTDPKARDNTWFKELLPDKVKTDDIANYLQKKNLPVGVVKNLDDGADFFGNSALGDVTMINPAVAKVKSLRYNNGMFDMTNPNIYKSILPAATGLGAASQLDKKQNGGWLDRYQDGGSEEEIFDLGTLPAVDINAGKYPYINRLTKQEKKLFNDPGPIGRSIRSKSMYKNPLDMGEVFTEAGDMLKEGLLEVSGIRPAERLINKGPVKVTKDIFNTITDIPYFIAYNNAAGLPLNIMFPKENYGEGLESTLDYFGAIPLSNAITKPIALGGKQFLKGVTRSLKNPHAGVLIRNPKINTSQNVLNKIDETDQLINMSSDKSTPPEVLYKKYLESSLTDDELLKLSGKTRKDIMDDIKTINDNKKLNISNTNDIETLLENTSNRDIERNRIRNMLRNIEANEPVPQNINITGTDWDVVNPGLTTIPPGSSGRPVGSTINLQRPEGYTRNRRRVRNLNEIINRDLPNLSFIQQPDIFQKTGNLLENVGYEGTKKILDTIGKLRLKNNIPYSEEQSQSLLNYLAYGEGIHSKAEITSQMKNAIKNLLESGPGNYKASSSLSDNSYPLYVRSIANIVNKYPDKYQAFMSEFKPLNTMGNKTQMVYRQMIDKENVVDAINNQLKDIKIKGKNIPKVYISGDNIIYPDINIKKFLTGGWLDKYQKGGPFNFYGQGERLSNLPKRLVDENNLSDIERASFNTMMYDSDAPISTGSVTPVMGPVEQLLFPSLPIGPSAAISVINKATPFVKKINADFYTKMLNSYPNMTQSTKNFYNKLIEGIKKQDGNVTFRQLNELERLKTRNFNFGPKPYKTGGWLDYVE
jgi:hypothetical protein